MEETTHTGLFFQNNYTLYLFFILFTYMPFLFLYLRMVNKLYTMINNLFTIINYFYIVVNNLYIIINKLRNLKGYFSTKTS